MERNHEHYPDNTCGKALKHIEHGEYRCTLGRLKRALKQAKRVFQDHGFEVWRPIVLKDKATGRIFDEPR